MSGTTIVHGEHGLNFAECTGSQSRQRDLTKTVLETHPPPCISEPGHSLEMDLALPRARFESALHPEWSGHGTVHALGRFLPGPARARAARERIRGGQAWSSPFDQELFSAAWRRARAGSDRPAFGGGINWRRTFAAGVDGGSAAARNRRSGLFPGRRRDVERCLPALDVFVLPSISEGMSNVVLEAMSAGLPVVCPSLPAHREIIDSGSDGILLDPCSSG